MPNDIPLNIGALAILINAEIDAQHLDIPKMIAHENNLIFEENTLVHNQPHIFFWDYNERNKKIEARFVVGAKYSGHANHKETFICTFDTTKRLDLIKNDVMKKLLIPGYTYFSSIVKPRYDEYQAETDLRRKRLNKFAKMLGFEKEITDDRDRISCHKNKVASLYVGNTNNIELWGITDQQTEDIIKIMLAIK